MTELAIREYWEGNLSLEDFAEQLSHCRVTSEEDSTHILVEMADSDKPEFIVTREHLVTLCDDVVRKKNLRQEDLNTIAYVLILSAHYSWYGNTEDGEIVATTIFDWDSPEINFPLSNANIKRWKTYLITGKNDLIRKES